MRGKYNSTGIRSRSFRAIEPLESRLLLAAIRYVDVNSPGPTHDGTSWDSAYVDLQQALSASGVGSGDQIRVADGTYKPTAGTDRSISFQLKSGVSLLGGYAGYGAVDPDARDVTANQTILSGDIGTAGSNSDNSYHVVVGSGTDATAVLDGFTITAGHANGSIISGEDGGGMYNSTGSPTVRDCTFTGNSAASNGGGLFTTGGTPTFTNCTFSNNTAGGAGGVYNKSTATYSGCNFTDNTSNTHFGGGLVNGSDATYVNCLFRHNSGYGNAGGVYTFLGKANFTGCRFEGNTAPIYGGAIYIVLGSATLTNCTLSGNSALVGAAIFCWRSSSATVDNSTLSGNAAHYSPYGAIALDTSCTLVVRNSILWGNPNPTGQQIATDPTSTATVRHSDVQGGYIGTGNRDVDPLFLRSPNPGLDNMWGTADDDFGDLRISAASPVADAASNSLVPAGVTTDLIGNSRFQDIPSTPDTGEGTAPIVDMGAYEAAAAPTAHLDGPYLVLAAQSLTLHGRGASTVGTTLQYDWEWSGDGKFDEASGADPVFSATSYPAGTALTISLRVTDSASQSAFASTTLRVVPEIAHVDANAPSGSAGDGTSWSNAFTSLSTALKFAVPGQTIRVADGVYKPTDTSHRNISFVLKSGVAVLGGYAGYGAGDPDARDYRVFVTVLSGDIGTPGEMTDNSYHVVVGSSTDATAILDGFTVSGGNARSTYAGHTGAGMLNKSGSPTVLNCTFSGNIAGTPSVGSGGGMYNDDNSSPTLTNCTFSGNSALYGGGLGNGYSSPLLTNCTFSGNSAKYGGEIYNGSSSAVLTNCIIWGSSSSPIYNVSSSTPVITYSDVQGGYTGTGNIDADPLFVRNPSPGADSVWGTEDDDYGDLRLQAGSPCIDAGSNAAVPAGITTDLAGNPRFADVPGVKDPGVIVDMGAYEVAVPLAAGSGEYLFDAPRPSLKIAFNANLSLQSLAAADLVLLNLTSGETIACGSTASVNYEQASSAATWAFGSILLPDGNYRATLPAGSVSDAAGQALSSDFSFEFFVLAGDANRDRKVDVGDLGILASNWQLSPRVFSQADFNYDSAVNVGDLGILATNWQKSLVEQTLSASGVTTSRGSGRLAAPSPFATTQEARSENRHRLLEDVGLLPV